MRIRDRERATRPRTSRREVTAHLRRAYALSAIAVAVSLALTVAAVGVLLLRLEPAVERYGRARGASSDLDSAAVEADRALGWFVHTRDPGALATYEEAVASLPRAEAELAAATRPDDPEVDDGVLALRLAERRWAAEARLLLGSVHGGAPTEVLVAGRARVRERFAELRDARAALHDLLGTRRDGALDHLQLMLEVAGGAQVLFLAALLVRSRRQTARLEALVGAPVRHLRATLDELRAGRLDASVEPAGFADLVAMGGDLNALAEVLRRRRDEAEARTAEIAAHAQDVRLILQLTREVSGNLDLPSVLDAVTRAVRSLSGDGDVQILLRDERDRLRPAPLPGDAAPADGATEGAAPVLAVAARAASSGRSVLEDVALAVPMAFGGQVIGVLQIAGGSGDARRAPLTVLETLATHAAAAIEAARLHQAARALGETDVLTGLPNRRRLDDDLAIELGRARRDGTRLGVVLLDIDHFKQVNDVFGHPVGDVVLREVAQVVGACLRHGDTAYRYGGEEFVVLARDTGRRGATAMAERIRVAVGAHLSSSPVGRVTASFGVAEAHRDGATAAEVIEAADAALYRAKALGRDRVVAAGSAAAQPAPALVG